MNITLEQLLQRCLRLESFGSLQNDAHQPGPNGLVVECKKRRNEETGFLPMRKQRRRSASQ